MATLTMENTNMNTDLILPHYLECLAWSSTDENGDSVDHLNFSEDAEKQSREDVEDFISLLEREGIPWADQWNDDQFGHDLALTRNHHGAGFWDRGLPLGDVLTTWAHSMGEACVYVNDETWELEVS